MAKYPQSFMTIGTTDPAQSPIQKCGKRSDGDCILLNLFWVFVDIQYPSQSFLVQAGACATLWTFMDFVGVSFAELLIDWDEMLFVLNCIS